MMAQRAGSGHRGGGSSSARPRQGRS